MLCSINILQFLTRVSEIATKELSALMPYWENLTLDSSFVDPSTLWGKRFLLLNLTQLLTTHRINDNVWKNLENDQNTVVYCSDHKRHDNFVDIGICPETSVKPRRLELADMNDTDEGSILPLTCSGFCFLHLWIGTFFNLLVRRHSLHSSWVEAWSDCEMVRPTPAQWMIPVVGTRKDIQQQKNLALVLS